MMKANNNNYSLETEIWVAAVGLLLNLFLITVSVGTLWYLFSMIFQSFPMMIAIQEIR
jgi:hypothetical protein